MMKAILALIFLGQPHAADVTVPKSQFVEEMKAGLPTAFCGEKTYFTKCFKATKDECLKQAKGDFDSCLAPLDAQLPAQLKQPVDGQTWGKKLGECAGAKFELALAAKKDQAPDCSNPEKWK